MVMDAPSPQSVGREFVRQYYTLLNKAPDHLHRFYNNSSSFVHGGLEPQNREATLVVGQKNIHNKIQQLNFRDCHAKISQVDSQSTLGNGVVVQVTGELSNDGQPMRRFTQTFVLAAQAPKKYYVHNDIFRYQDLYTDEENDGENRSENDEDQDGENVVETIQPISHQQPIYYPTGPTIQGYPQQQPQLQQQQQMNGAVHDDLQPGLVNQSIQTPTIPQQLTLPADPNNISTMPPVQNKVVETVEPVPQQPTLTMDTEISAYNEQSLPMESEPTKDANQPEKIIRDDTKIIPTEPPSYANLLKSDTISSGMSFASAMSNNSGSVRPVNTYSSRTQQDARSETSQSLPAQQRQINSRQQPRVERKSSNANQYADNHQLFLGNVPHHATEEALKVIFSKFGTVVDLRICSKPGARVTGGRSPPNYGFIVYDDPESVQQCLAHTPLYFPDDSADGQKLNIEEKKTRNVNGGGGGGGGNVGMNRNMSESKYSGGPRMDRGGNDRGGNDRGNNDSRGNNDRNSGDRGGNNDRGASDRGLNRGPSSAGGMLRGAPRGGSGTMSNNNNVRGGTSFNRNADNRTGGTTGGVIRGGNGQGNGQQAGGNYARR